MREPTDGDPSATRWSSIASWYDTLLVDGSGPHELATRTTVELLPDPLPASVLDVACGQGLAARALAAAGVPSVAGVDVTPEMIELAVAHERAQPLGITYRVDDATTLATVADASTDAVSCQLGLMDVDDLDAALAAIHRVLRPGGAFVLVITHPCFLAPMASTMPDSRGRLGRYVNEYFSERFWRSPNPDGVRRVGTHHHTLSTYLNALVATGFTVEQVTEPRATDDVAAQQPEYRNVPMYFAARARRS